ncbi:MAG: ABC transporter permease [Candidatus Sulfotelmatobacter sp.]
MRKLRALWMRWRGNFGGKQTDHEFSVELESHLQMHIEDNVRAGMTPEQARREALMKLGGLEQARQAYRERKGLPWPETLWQDIRFGLRMLRKQAGFTTISVLMLALGIGATTAIFSSMKAVLMAPLPYKDPGRIVAVWTANPASGGQPGPSTAGDFAAWKRSGIFADLAPSYDDQMTLTGQGAPQFLIGYAVSANYLRILGVEPQIGRLYSEQEDRAGGPKVALLSDHTWRTTFHSDPNIAGATIVLDGSPYTVLGVMPRGFNYPASVEVWTPSAIPPSALDDFKKTYVRILGRLKPGMTLAQTQKAVNDVEAVIAASHADTDSGNHVVLVPLREQLTGDVRMPLLILMGSVGLVLLIACANAAGLALARDAKRQKEIAVRLALGVTRLRLLRQFMTESLLLAIFGGAAGILLALAGTHFLLMLFPTDVANLNIPKITEIPIDRGVFLFAIAVTLLTGVLSGIVPVLKALRTEADLAIKDISRGNSRQSNRSRSAIVIGEIALSLVLLTGAGLVATSFRKVVNTDLGFQADHLLSMQVFLPPDHYPSSGEARRLFVEQVVKKLNAMPGVKSAAVTNFLPLSGFWGTINFLRRGQSPPQGGDGPEADNLIITPEYLHTMNIALLRGRTFSDADRNGGLQVAMINETLAKQYFKDRDPIGEELNLGSGDKPDWWQIVGVTGDVKSFGQDQPTHANVYRPFDQIPFPLVAFTLRTETDPASMVQAAEQTLWSVDPNLPVLKAVPMDLLANQTLAVRRASSVLISSFAFLALILSCIGIYGVMAYTVAQRTQEIGVRMALGAERANVLRMIMRFAIRLMFAGVIIGLVGAFASSRFLASLLFEVSPISPLIFSVAIAVLVAVTLLASYPPARRAASIEPIRALRTE